MWFSVITSFLKTPPPVSTVARACGGRDVAADYSNCRWYWQSAADAPVMDGSVLLMPKLERVNTSGDAAATVTAVAGRHRRHQSAPRDCSMTYRRSLFTLLIDGRQTHQSWRRALLDRLTLTFVVMSRRGPDTKQEICQKKRS